MICYPAHEHRLAWASDFCGNGRGSFWNIVQPGAFGIFLGDVVGEGAVLARCVIGVLVPGTFVFKEPVELLLVEGGALLRSISDGDDVVGAALALAGLR